MARTASTMLPLGTSAPDFQLPNVTTGEIISLANFANKKANTPYKTVFVFLPFFQFPSPLHQRSPQMNGVKKRIKKTIQIPEFTHMKNCHGPKLDTGYNFWPL